MNTQIAKEKISLFYRDNKRMPTYAEIAVMLKLKSKNSVFKLVAKLIGENFLTKDNSGRLIPLNIVFPLKVLGLIQAGFPTPAEEELVDTISLDEYLIENKNATFMLRVSGDSMIGAGIMENDLVLADRSVTPRPGDIVIAEVDSEWTMKYLRKNGAKIWLEAANKKYKPIYPEEELKIAAVVRAVIRKY